MNNYLSSQVHRFGCISLIGCCLFILFSSPIISWVYILPFSYLIGCLISFSKAYVINFFRSFISSKRAESSSQFESATVNDQQAPSLLLNQLLVNLNTLELKAKPFLKPTGRKLVSDIDDIMKLMTRKLNESNTEAMSVEISDIQRTLSNYLTPALEYYCNLPKFLHHRKIENSIYTPHELVELQLKVILEEMLKISETIYENDLHQLIDHSQFLKQKLKSSEFFHISTK